MSILGPRSYYQYKGEDGNTYQIFTRKADGDAVSNVEEAEGAHAPLPRSVTPRHVWFVNSAGLLRRSIYIGDPANPIYKINGTISLDGDTWRSQGRVGEKTRGTLAG